MNKNRLGQSDLYVSEIGLGCMSLPNDEMDAAAIVHRALDVGINFFDTADLYGQGRNEELLGKALEGHRNEVVIATKVGNRFEPGQPGWRWDASGAYIKQAVFDSLKRLGTDYIDLYQLHGGTLDDDMDEVIAAFDSLKKEGWIRFYGISSIRPNVIKQYVKRSQIVSVMMQYSILDRRPEEEILDLLHANQVSVIARGPLAKGLLSAQAADRVTDDGYLDYSKAEILELAQKLRDMAGTASNPSHTAMRYALAHPAVATAIPGSSKVEQLVENAAVAHMPPLSEEQLDRIRSWSHSNIYRQHRE
ncbi:aldo/keto reductase [Alicyclobacillus tolerans]|uniref:aldo/keto reductase n=1 Tax=Alicyclobacillus tolerans TaxID=90970 RepID=UPI001F1BED9D|nr:aldo/keto reductase [Alicyclobacillus tolerans]MCF8564087.1 aldo/keto reductase [Alicyclobacillus tolerans]